MLKHQYQNAIPPTHLHVGGQFRMSYGKLVGPEGNHLNLLFRATGVKPEHPPERRHMSI